MARRKKEPQSNHRQAIGAVATQLFSEFGFENISMNEIAKQSGYSKATLYVYFKDKEELISYLTLQSMQTLFNNFQKVLSTEKSVKEKFYDICFSLVDYYKESPVYFALLLKNIEIDDENGNFLDDEKETFIVGEKINALLFEYLQKGVKDGSFKQDLDLFNTVFSLFGMICGFIQLAFNKQNYIQKTSAEEVSEFLTKGFDLLYSSIEHK